MTDEQYKKLNEYLNECFLRLQVSEPIFIENLRIISYISDIIIKSFEVRIVNESKQNNLTYEDVYLLAREIVGNINKSYLEKFDNLIRSGILSFGYDTQYKNSTFSYIKNMDQEIIDINRTFNYEDVGILVHEFIHSTNCGKNKTNNSRFLSEFISIYFEEYSKKYLIEEKNVDIKEIGINTRIIDFLYANRSFNHYCLVLLAYDILGNINPNTQNEMKEILNIKDKIFEKECLDILNKIEKTEKTTLSNENVYDKIVNYFAIHYKYIVGTLLTYYALNYCKFEDIVKLNEKINSDEYKNMSIQEILETIGINLNDNFISKAIQCIKNNIYEKKVIK